MPNYSQLNPELLVATVEQLSKRVGERFPQAGLFKVSRHLCDIARESRRRVVEGLTTGLSRKIWQKLMIIHAGPK